MGIGFQPGEKVGSRQPSLARHEQDMGTDSKQEIAISFAWRSRVHTPAHMHTQSQRVQEKPGNTFFHFIMEGLSTIKESRLCSVGVGSSWRFLSSLRIRKTNVASGYEEWMGKREKAETERRGAHLGHHIGLKVKDTSHAGVSHPILHLCCRPTRW